ncbi:putative multidrug export ATP-binding/permease protein [Ruminiclostridium hungatei]|uniref:Putative multidrug export ATP-binding/permease protein n=2 Tax=Ruminiclostridium hungatei TaxID=48256 RepID=A0A1V4SIQ5_RUMHU|nr:putative multidrug export ATP-binding/permease protein [Ruminiclostridium hungatei]
MGIQIMIKEKNSASALKLLKIMVNKDKSSLWKLLLVYAAAIISASLAVVRIHGMRILINGTVEKDIEMAYSGLLLLFCFNILFAPVLGFFEEYMSQRLTADANQNLQEIAMESIIKCRIEYLTGQHSSELLHTILTSIARAVDGVVKITKGILSAVCSAAVVIFYLFLKGSSMFLGIALITAGLSLLLIPLFSKFKKAYSREEAAKHEMEAFVQDAVLGAEVIRTYSMKENFARIFSEKYRKFLDKSKISSIINSSIINVKFIIGLAGALFIFTYGWFLTVNGKMDAGTLMAFFLGFWITMEPISRLSVLWSDFLEARLHAQRFFKLIDFEQEAVAISYAGNSQTNIKAHMEAHKEEFRITFKDVCFSYGNNQVLKGISFEVRENTAVAIVGPSGAGKTTLLNLLVRFVRPCSGSITLNNIDINEYDLDYYRSLTAVVPQEPVVFSTSFYNNISYGNLKAGPGEIVNSAKIAGIHDFIMNCKDGYYSVVSERAVNISGGERQRLSIARAILRNPKILILDEPTSSLDSYNETLVNEVICSAKKAGVVFVVSHRMSTIAGADVILFIDGGKIAEIGSPQELMAARGRYYKWIISESEDSPAG